MCARRNVRDVDFFFIYCTEMEIAFFFLCLKQKKKKKKNPPRAHSILNEMSYLHEGNKCQLRIGPLTNQASYRCCMRHSVCVNEYIKPP